MVEEMVVLVGQRKSDKGMRLMEVIMGMLPGSQERRQQFWGKWIISKIEDLALIGKVKKKIVIPSITILLFDMGGARYWMLM